MSIATDEDSVSENTIYFIRYSCVRVFYSSSYLPGSFIEHLLHIIQDEDSCADPFPSYGMRSNTMLGCRPCDEEDSMEVGPCTH